MTWVDAIEGVVITFDLGDHTLPVESNGYLGKLSSGKGIINARIQRGKDSYGFNVDGKKNVILKKDWAPLQKPPFEGKYYRTIIEIKKDLKGVYCTKYPNNNMRLLDLGKNGELSIWSIALISQGGHFFLSAQQQYKTCCFREGEKVVCPFFDRPPHEWPQVVELLNQLLSDKVVELSQVTEYRPEPEPTANGLIQGVGRVIWWNYAQGMGAIVTPEGQARVHWSHVSPRDRLAFLIPGELVRYQSLRKPPQRLPSRSSFQNEAIGVEAIT
jgi:hypothetical protein